MDKKMIPIHHVGTPHVGLQQPPTISPDQPIYSVYSGNQIGTGGIPWGTKNDAPAGHPNHSGIFHGIVYNPYFNGGVWMAHKWS